MPRRFEFVEGNSSKFWEIEKVANSVTTWWGRIGTAGQSKTKSFGSEAEANNEYDKLVLEKTKKGYQEVGGGAPRQSQNDAPQPVAPINNKRKQTAQSEKGVTSDHGQAPITHQEHVSSVVTQEIKLDNQVVAHQIAAHTDKSPAPVRAMPEASSAESLRFKSPEILYYVKAGVPSDVIASELGVPKDAVKKVEAVFYAEIGQSTPALLDECGVSSSEIPVLKREHMLMRTEELWRRASKAVTEHDRKYINLLVEQNTSNPKPSPTDIALKLGPVGVFEFAAFVQKWTAQGLADHERVFQEIESKGLSKNIAQMEQEWAKIRALSEQHKEKQEQIDNLRKDAESRANAMLSAEDEESDPFAFRKITVSEEAQQLLSKFLEQVSKSIPEKTSNPFALMFPSSPRIAELPATNEILKLPSEKQSEVLLATLQQVLTLGKSQLRISSTGIALQELLGRLTKHSYRMADTEAAMLVQAGAFLYKAGSPLPPATVVGTLEKTLGDSQPPSNHMKEAISSYIEALAKGPSHWSNGPDAEGQKTIQKLKTFLARTNDGKAPIPIEPQEAWADCAIADLNNLDNAERNQWIQLLDHCSKATGTKPSGTWLKKATSLLESIGELNFIAYVEKWLRLVANKGTRTTGFNHQFEPDPAYTIAAGNADILRGLVWCCATQDDPAIASALGDAAEASFKKVPNLGPRCPKVGNACVHALSQLNSKEAVAQLSRVQSRVKHSSSRTQIEKALNNAAENAGMTVDDLQDLGIPDFGMTEVGRLRQQVGTWFAEIAITTTDKPALQWVSSTGKTQQSVPAEVKSNFADEVKALKKIEAELEKLLPTIRSRIEKSLINQRHWRFDIWRDRYLNHPVCGTIARRLLWNFNGKAGIWHDGKFIGENGQPFQPEDGALVELWHPIGALPESVLQWRRWINEHQIVQPFKQCHREIYVLTDAERQTETYSNRFARHIVRQHQLQHLCKQRGWEYQLMGGFDFQSTPTLDLPRWNMQVEFWVDVLEEERINAVGIFNNVATEQVKFLRKTPVAEQTRPRAPHAYRGFDSAFTYEEIPLTEIMPVLFSEVMRDIDLFISVCSIGAAPERAEGRHAEYWNNYSFGDLSNAAEMRKEVLAELIPSLKIADRCKIDSKFLTVRGDIRTYKIHIGSGNILMEPNDQYLCIVQARGAAVKEQPVFLPFEGDTVLSVILSKAFLLAEDKKITEPAIVNQIRRGI